MKSHIVADGEDRFYNSEEFQARVRALRAAVQASCAAELARAGFWRRLVLLWRIQAEFGKQRRKLEPSSQALYSSHPAAREPRND